MWAVAKLGLRWGASWPEVLPASMTRFPAGDDPIPATVFGTRSKPSGALGLLIRGVGVAFICRARAKVLAAAARPSACRDVPAAVAAAPSRKSEAWLTWLVRTAELGDCEESSMLAWAWH